ncbi:hypothetical protein TNCV_5140111 [Trichonephila clavipes]|nr:hypothetical protein TNCV_5140111 [Trichonephila clavipes]
MASTTSTEQWSPYTLFSTIEVNALESPSPKLFCDTEHCRETGNAEKWIRAPAASISYRYVAPSKISLTILKMLRFCSDKYNVLKKLRHL